MLRRIYSQMYKNIRILMKNYYRLFDVTVWPLTLLFSVVLFVNFLNASNEMIAMVILGIMGWRAVYHFQIEMTTCYMDEYWSNSLNHFLISPLRKIEFVIGNIITGGVKFVLVFFLYLAIGKAFFSFALPPVSTFIFGISVLACFGVIVGFFTIGTVILYRDNASAVAFILPDLLVLLSGVYYPITIFPSAVQAVVKFIPAVYGFDILKSTLGLAEVNYVMLVATMAGWLVLSLVFLRYCINHAKKTGRLGKMV